MNSEKHVAVVTLNQNCNPQASQAKTAPLSCVLIVFLNSEKSAATDLVSDSGAESCSEEARIKTAEAFMTGIHSALSASIPDLNGRVSEGQGEEVEGDSEDIVTEVDNVLGKLMASLQRGFLSQ